MQHKKGKRRGRGGGAAEYNGAFVLERFGSY